MVERYVLDKLDAALLYELDLNARTSNVQLAKRLHCSEHVIAYRINRLLSRGIIKQFQAIVNGSKLALMYFRFYLRLQNMTTLVEEKFIQRLVSNPFTTWVISTRGKYDLIFSMYAKSVPHFLELQEQLFSNFDEHILEKNIVLVAQVPTYSRAFLIREKKPKEFVYISVPGQPVLDDVDWNILSALGSNARVSNLELGKQFHVSPDTIRNRIQKLSSDGILRGYRAVSDLRRIGYLSYLISLRLHHVTQKRMQGLEGFVQFQPNILFVVKCIGDHELDLELEVANEDELDSVLNQLKNSFTDIIKDFDVLAIPREHKYAFFPLHKEDLQL